jgi:hypothetical protein
MVTGRALPPSRYRKITGANANPPRGSWANAMAPRPHPRASAVREAAFGGEPAARACFERMARASVTVAVSSTHSNSRPKGRFRLVPGTSAKPIPAATSARGGQKRRPVARTAHDRLEPAPAAQRPRFHRTGSARGCARVTISRSASRSIQAHRVAGGHARGGQRHDQRLFLKRTDPQATVRSIAVRRMNAAVSGLAAAR